MTVEKFEFRKAYPELYAPKAGDFVLVEVPPLQYLAYDGSGDPNTSEEYVSALECLYPTAYAVKFASKKDLDRDFTVGPLEGQWRADDMEAFTRGAKDEWDWTMLVAQPAWITRDMVRAAVTAVQQKKGLPGLDRLRLVTLDEGTSVQILYIGAYDAEGPVLERLHHQWMPAHGLTFNGDHHEVYLSDPRRTAAEKLRTVLRQPVRPLQPSD
ncbi:GyrI-like domain-containing protein [Arthrobacter sp. zg-Y820]|uniref:GyrI-like domain-containing protein n=1 Tax=unclassified Arthrobacter TaxID=235627 RepID=UPI001E63E637|nr:MULTISPECIES: GyrI-like domain-containing protein [unclassified Arthrobacter]MCC9197112.1 GyrI-like domain-containing protein [Arthrobacter sp. zg-Y820]MDK1279977.1 GyrI-like domain-containing protein [Arthrobacter sp. zg.Y820]MDK1361665.1 GyrI-like domain-containing protein [Arthrobacter sp. zg-Y1219]WIB09276.1 GyrI-like domain-containing protein [Arthrobacter sp. zg-Y820]